jgi:hypothetical protein
MISTPYSPLVLMSLMDLDDGQGVFALLGSGGKHGKNIEN